jgi:hypothetical protein
MKNVYEVLREKELEISRVETEVEALRIAAPLLSEEGEEANDDRPTLARSNPPLKPAQVPAALNTNPQPDHAVEWKEKAQG